MALVMPHGTVTRYADGSLRIQNDDLDMRFPHQAVTAVLNYLVATEAALPAAATAVADEVAANQAAIDAAAVAQAQSAVEVTI